MRIKVIILEPKYQINLGHMARAAKNFGVRKLYFINPRAKLTGATARMFAKHAFDLLENAAVYKDLDSATKDCDLLVGTTAITKKAKANFRRIFFAEEAVEKLKRMKGGGTVGLVIGRDDIGMRSDELEKCDMLAYISTNPDYPVLNIAHALAIFLYLLKRAELKTYSDIGFGREDYEKQEMKTLLGLFGRLIDKKKMRNRKAVLEVFSRIVRNAQPSKQELHALITALK